MFDLFREENIIDFDASIALKDGQNDQKSYHHNTDKEEEEE